jgi:hypothetical protein
MKKPFIFGVIATILVCLVILAGIFFPLLPLLPEHSASFLGNGMNIAIYGFITLILFAAIRWVVTGRYYS